MRKLLLSFAAAAAAICLCAEDASATANFVYHEQTANFVATPTCPSAGTDSAGGRYVENTDRSGSSGYQVYSPEKYTLEWKVEFQFFTNSVAVYYTTDGSTPSGSFGTGNGTTQVVKFVAGTATGEISYFHIYQDQTQGCQVVDVIRASIPPQLAGKTVKYVLSAWHSEGGPEVFANSGTCTACFPCTSGTSGCATVFNYDVVAPPATPLIISEFRLRGPGTGASGSAALDEFVEIYNNSDSPVTVEAFDGSAGFALAAADGLTRFTIPNGTVIPARGHYLGTNSGGYSLGSYPASTAAPGSGGGGGEPDTPVQSSSPSTARRAKTRTPPPSKGLRGPKASAAPGNDTVPGPSATASGDATYTVDIADNVGIALFNTANAANFSETTRLDAVGSTAEANTLYKEGTGYPAVVPTNSEHSFLRDQCGKGGSVTTPGRCSRSTPQDTGANEADFIFVSTNGVDIGAGERLGAPGPENSTSPIQRTALMPGSVLFPCVSSSASPNRERALGSDPTNNATHGTLAFRIRVTNATGANVTRLRFRIIDLSTYPSGPSFADLRARSSSVTVVTNPCTSLPATIQGTTLEQPPNQTEGGGFNSTLSAGTVTSVSPIPPGDDFDFQLVVGVEQTGRFKFYVIVEVLP